MNAQKLQSSVEGAGQFHLLVENGDHQIGCHCDPYLRLHRVGTRAVEVFDSQMLLDPSEEQFYAPARLLEHGHCQRRDLQVVGEEDQFSLHFRVVVAHFSQKGRKGISRFGELGFAYMIALHAGEVRQLLSKAKRAVKNKGGKALVRRRGEHIERSFCHVLDHGKHRRATFRGRGKTDQTPAHRRAEL